MKKSLIIAAASALFVVGCGENQGGGVGEQPAGYNSDQGVAPATTPEPGTPTDTMTDTNTIAPGTESPGTTVNPGTNGAGPGQP